MASISSSNKMNIFREFYLLNIPLNLLSSNYNMGSTIRQTANKLFK